MADGSILREKWSPRVSTTATLRILTISSTSSLSHTPTPRLFVVDRYSQSNSQLTSSGYFPKVPSTEQRPVRCSASVNWESERLISAPDDQAAALKAKATAQGLTLEGWFQKMAQRQAPASKPRYGLSELMQQCDPNAPLSDEDRAWMDAPAPRGVIGAARRHLSRRSEPDQRPRTGMPTAAPPASLTISVSAITSRVGSMFSQRSALITNSPIIGMNGAL
jgi:hypothetical protein